MSWPNAGSHDIDSFLSNFFQLLLLRAYFCYFKGKDGINGGNIMKFVKNLLILVILGSMRLVLAPEEYTRSFEPSTLKPSSPEKITEIRSKHEDQKAELAKKHNQEINDYNKDLRNLKDELKKTTDKKQREQIQDKIDIMTANVRPNMELKHDVEKVNLHMDQTKELLDFNKKTIKENQEKVKAQQKTEQETALSDAKATESSLEDVFSQSFDNTQSKQDSAQSSLEEVLDNPETTSEEKTEILTLQQKLEKNHHAITERIEDIISIGSQYTDFDQQIDKVEKKGLLNTEYIKDHVGGYLEESITKCLSEKEWKDVKRNLGDQYVKDVFSGKFENINIIDQILHAANETLSIRESSKDLLDVVINNTKRLYDKGMSKIAEQEKPILDSEAKDLLENSHVTLEEKKRIEDFMHTMEQDHSVKVEQDISWMDDLVKITDNYEDIAKKLKAKVQDKSLHAKEAKSMIGDYVKDSLSLLSEDDLSALEAHLRDNLNHEDLERFFSGDFENLKLLDQVSEYVDKSAMQDSVKDLCNTIIENAKDLYNDYVEKNSSEETGTKKEDIDNPQEHGLDQLLDTIKELREKNNKPTTQELDTITQAVLADSKITSDQKAEIENLQNEVEQAKASGDTHQEQGILAQLWDMILNILKKWGMLKQ